MWPCLHAASHDLSPSVQVLSPLLLEEELHIIFGRVSNLFSKSLADAYARLEPLVSHSHAAFLNVGDGAAYTVMPKGTLYLVWKLFYNFSLMLWVSRDQRGRRSVMQTLI